MNKASLFVVTPLQLNRIACIVLKSRSRIDKDEDQLNHSRLQQQIDGGRKKQPRE
jgi:hypothetical protein